MRIQNGSSRRFHAGALPKISRRPSQFQKTRPVATVIAATISVARRRNQIPAPSATSASG